MKFFDVVSIEEARSLMIKNLDLTLGYETVDLLDSLDRSLYEDIVSKEDVPGFNRSTVDGYAISTKDSHGASESLPSFLSLKGEIKMGEVPSLSIKSGEAVYIPTGGMLPEGADGIIMIENVAKMDEDTLLLYKSIAAGDNIVYKDDDIGVGNKVLSKGKTISPQDIGVLASLGIDKVKVFNRPSFYIISTGDEVIDLDGDMEIGKIRDINSYVLAALVKKLGGSVNHRTIIGDDFESLRNEVKKGIDTSDITILSGGSSVGTKDFTHDVINSFDGRGVFIHGMSIKPGKPTIVGEAKGKAVVGLPGHPVSSMMVFKSLIEYYVHQLRNSSPKNNKTRAIVDSNFPSSPGRTTYQMVTLEERDGKLYCRPNFGKSGLITLLSNSSGYIIIELEEEGINKGEERDVYFI